jgi:L-alanine-DL-glutamate epimerase-like enolase superfamily enzyme
VVKFSTGQLAAAEHVLVRVRSDEHEGFAEAPARAMVYGESVPSIVHAVRAWFAPALIGTDPLAVERIWAAMDGVERNPTAKAAVEMAALDLAARHLGVPLHRLLGGWGGAVEVTHLLGLGAPEAIAAQAVELRRQHGFGTFKLKAGIDPARDTAMIRTVRAALGPDIRLTVDCNHGYDSLTAARVLPRWEEHDIAWVEEPCPGWDVQGRAALARATRLPLMADESCTTVAEVAEEIRRGHCRFLSIKTARTGYGHSRRIVHLMEAAGGQTAIGSQGDTDIGTLCAAHFHAAHRATSRWPGELSYFLDVADTLTTAPPVIRDGRIVLSDAAGLGAAIDEDKLKRYRTDT